MGECAIGLIHVATPGELHESLLDPGIGRLGQLFRLTEVEESRTELVILVTPQILDAPSIRRVREDAEDALDALDELRRQRVRDGDWWRRPFNESYEVSHAHRR